MAEFVYNNKMYSSTKTSPFKANYRQNPRMGFKGRKKEKYEEAEKFVKKMKEIQEEAKAALGKAQEEIKKYADRKQAEVDDHKVEDLVMLSTKDLKYQIVERRTEKLIEKFVGPYKIKKIISPNTVELELPSTVKIHPVVNVSRGHKYIEQVEGQKKEQPALVIIEEEEEWEVKRILNKRQVRGKDKYLVCWKGFIAESDTQEERENLKNAKKAIKEFKKEYRQDIENVTRQEHEKKTFRRGELLGRFMIRKLFGWSNERYDQEYQGRLERNWRQWKGRQSRERKMETITKEKEIKEENSGIRE